VEALRVGDFQRKLPPGVEVASVEGRAGEVVAVQALRDAFPSVAELYIECPPGHGLAGLLDAVARVGARAKLRTGGIRAGDFAEPETVARFVTACARARLPFKATAGLHHPVRGRYPLTYESGSACATMFGYLNLVLAATLAWEGAPEATVVDALRLDDGAALVAGDDDIKWGELGCTTTTLARARAEFVIAIGSCSFTEPLGEIRQR
jgi:hypothetical protein